MIALILDMLELDDFENMSEEIDIAKGKNKLHTNWRKVYKQKRRWRKK